MFPVLYPMRCRDDNGRCHQGRSDWEKSLYGPGRERSVVYRYEVTVLWGREILFAGTSVASEVLLADISGAAGPSFVLDGDISEETREVLNGGTSGEAAAATKGGSGK